MSVVMKGNYIFVQPGQKAFMIASNFTNYLELGAKGITDYYLEAKVENDEFIINAKIYDPQNKEFCIVTNNFPEKSDFRKEMTPNGYCIFSKTGVLLLGIEANAEICYLKGKIYNISGEVVAEEKNEDYMIYRGPATIGKLGNSMGIVLG